MMVLGHFGAWKQPEVYVVEVGCCSQEAAPNDTGSYSGSYRA